MPAIMLYLGLDPASDQPGNAEYAMCVTTRPFSTRTGRLIGPRNRDHHLEPGKSSPSIRPKDRYWKN